MARKSRKYINILYIDKRIGKCTEAVFVVCNGVRIFGGSIESACKRRAKCINVYVDPRFGKRGFELIYLCAGVCARFRRAAVLLHAAVSGNQDPAIADICFVIVGRDDGCVLLLYFHTCAERLCGNYINSVRRFILHQEFARAGFRCGTYVDNCGNIRGKQGIDNVFIAFNRNLGFGGKRIAVKPDFFERVGSVHKNGNSGNGACGYVIRFGGGFCACSGGGGGSRCGGGCTDGSGGIFGCRVAGNKYCRENKGNDQQIKLLFRICFHVTCKAP